MKTILITLLAITSLMGCSDRMMPYIAKNDVNGYKDANDLPAMVSYIIREGTVCEIGEKEYVGKVDGFVKARCPEWSGLIMIGSKKKEFKPLPRPNIQ
jgi:hypothetical protein